MFRYLFTIITFLLMALCMLTLCIKLTECAGLKRSQIVVVGNGNQEVQKAVEQLVQEETTQLKALGLKRQSYYWNIQGAALVKQKLESYGYYSASVEIEDQNSMILKFDPGIQYTISDIQIIHEKNSNKSALLPSISSCAIKAGDPAVAENILNEQEALAEKIDQNNCLLTLKVVHEVAINHVDKTISLLYKVYAGDSALIGAVNFVGAKKLTNSFFKKIVKLEQGRCFRRSTILDAQTKLQKTNLFSLINTDVGNEIDKQMVPITFHLTERKFRNFKLGLAWTAQTGAGISVGWRHRNLLSHAETLEIDALLSHIEQNLRIGYMAPYFRNDTKLLVNFIAGNSSLNRYNTKDVALYAGFEYQLLETLSARYGIKTNFNHFNKYKYPHIEQAPQILLLSLPLRLVFDMRDDIVNPHKGYVFYSKLAPVYNCDALGNNFIKTKIQGNYYLPIDRTASSVLAFRNSIGFIIGPSISDIPINQRYYIGGGNSIRGYAYQQIAYFNHVQQISNGGKFFFHSSFEYRYAPKNQLGFTVFYDLGTLYPDTWPDFRQLSLFHSIGFGIRYDTFLGPLRADVALPLNRDGVHIKPQFYLSIRYSF